MISSARHGCIPEVSPPTISLIDQPDLFDPAMMRVIDLTWSPSLTGSSSLSRACQSCVMRLAESCPRVQRPPPYFWEGRWPNVFFTNRIMNDFIVGPCLWLGRCVRQGTSVTWTWKKDRKCCQLLFSAMCRKSSLQPDVKGTGRQRVGIWMFVLCTSTAAKSIDVAPLLLFIINDLEKSSSCFPQVGLFPASDAWKTPPQDEQPSIFRDL